MANSSRKGNRGGNQGQGSMTRREDDDRSQRTQGRGEREEQGTGREGSGRGGSRTGGTSSGGGRSRKGKSR